MKYMYRYTKVRVVKISIMRILRLHFFNLFQIKYNAFPRDWTIETNVSALEFSRNGK